MIHIKVQMPFYIVILTCKESTFKPYIGDLQVNNDIHCGSNIISQNKNKQMISYDAKNVSQELELRAGE
jgi:hypothetical protein